jgi:hypothetical protein
MMSILEDQHLLIGIAIGAFFGFLVVIGGGIYENELERRRLKRERKELNKNK